MQDQKNERSHVEEATANSIGFTSNVETSSLRGKRLHVFSDFDGTIMKEDTGVLLIDKGMGITARKELDKQILNGTMSFREAVTIMWAAVKDKDMQTALKELEDGGLVNLASYFLEFYAWMRKQDNLFEPLTIVSSGLLPILEHFLSIHNIEVVESNSTNKTAVRVLANRVIVHEEPGKGWEIIYRDESSFGHDKGQHLRDVRSKDSFIIFIGDGVSDMPAAREADLVFAKQGKDLVTFCLRETIPCVVWKDFSDIFNHLNNLISDIL